MSTSWRVELLGGLRAIQGERVITHFETRKTALLLAYLAFYPQQIHSREMLAERLWPDEEPEATRNRLRQALSALRRDLEPPEAAPSSVLIADRLEVRIAPNAVMTDVADFETALTTAQQDGHACLHRAIEIYRGELLPGYYEEWITPERERLAEAYRNALGLYAQALARSGDYIQAIDYARRAVNADPLQEAAHVLLMRLYAAAGRTSDMLRQYHELERLLREELNAAPSASTQALLAQLRTGSMPHPVAPLSASSKTSPSPSEGEGRGWVSPSPSPLLPFSPSDTRECRGGEAEPVDLEPEGGAVQLESPFYIVRPTDEEFRNAIARQDSIVLVKGARQIGKTSLLARGLQQAREAGARVVLTDLQKFSDEQLESAGALFLTFAEVIIDQLDLDISLESHWDPRRGWNVNFERFLRREVLGTLPGPLVWALDEVDRLFSYPFSSVVFGLFRSWHNERSLNPAGPWKRLTLAIAYATEAHLFIKDLNQSPFNVGTRLALEDFTREEVAELNHRYGSPLQNEAAIARYFGLVGGHPFLVRRGLHAMATHRLDVGALQAQAERDDGIFGDHLRRLLSSLVQDPELCDAVRAVVRGKPCPQPESFYRLRSAGVVKGSSAQNAQVRCTLYRNYFERHLQ